MNIHLYDERNYAEKRLALRSPEDKESCLKLLTHGNRHFNLCHNYYSEHQILLIIESSDYILFYHGTDSIENIVGFALVKLRKNHMLDILLLRAISNEEFGNMIMHLAFDFAIEKKCRTICTVPRTPALRRTCMKYGFETYRGVQEIDEMLIKNINLITLPHVNKTRKSRTPTFL